MKRFACLMLVALMAAATASPSFSMTHHRKHHKMKHPIAMISRVDINTASHDELMQLKGVDAATADKIIAGRPWKDAKDLVTQGIISEKTYKDIHLKVSTKMPKSTSKT